MLSSSIVMAQMDQLDQLVASFKELKEQLLTVCEEHDQERPRSNRTRGMLMMMGRSRRARNRLSPQVRTKLTKIVKNVDDILPDLMITQSHPEPPMDAEVIEEQPHNTCQVYIIGPPGAEPRTLSDDTESDTRCEKQQSMVYQRNSASITLGPYVATDKLTQIKMKDSPLSTCEIFLKPLKDGQGSVRYTRAKERACLGQGSSGVTYREQSSEIDVESTSDNDDEFYSPDDDDKEYSDERIRTTYPTTSAHGHKLSHNSDSIISGKRSDSSSSSYKSAQESLDELKSETENKLSASSVPNSPTPYQSVGIHHLNGSSPESTIEVHQAIGTAVIESRCSTVVDDPNSSRQWPQQDYEMDSRTDSEETPPQSPLVSSTSSNKVSPKPSGIFVVLEDLQNSFAKKKKKNFLDGSTRDLRSSSTDVTKLTVSVSVPQRTPVLKIEKLSLDVLKRLSSPKKEPVSLSPASSTFNSHRHNHNDPSETEHTDDEKAPFLEDQESRRVKRERHSRSSWSDFEEDILLRSPHSNRPLEKDVPVSSLLEPPDASFLLSDTELPNDKGSVSKEDNSDHLSPSIFPKRPPSTPPARKSRKPNQHSKESGRSKRCASPPSTPHWANKTSQRQLFDSEDDFDMAISHPPPFKSCTPSQKLKTPKRRKVLKVPSDDEAGCSNHSNESKPPTLKTERSSSLSSHSRDVSKDADTDDGSNSVNNEPRGDAQALNNDKTVNADSGTRFTDKKEAKNKKLPKKIPCCACGLLVFWRTKPLHKHPRLDGLVCGNCLTTIMEGEFTVSDGHEEYCTLCGDGGDILMCGSCIRSNCKGCVERVSGTEFLNNLLEDDDQEFTCYCCDPLPMEPHGRIMQLYLSRKQSKAKHINFAMKKKVFKTPEHVSDSEEGITAVEKSKPAKKEAEGESMQAEKKSAAKHQRSCSPNSIASNDFSDSEADSPDVDTDDIDLSDSSVFGKDKKRKLKRKRHSSSEANAQQPIKTDTKNAEGSSKSVAFTRKKRRYIKRFKLDGSDFECGSDESSNNSDMKISNPSKMPKKKVVSPSSSMDELNLHTGCVKRSKLADMLSSGDDSDQVNMDDNALTVSMGESTENDHCFRPSTPDKGPFSPVTYLTPSSKMKISSESSDNEFQVVRPKSKKRRVLSRLSSKSTTDYDSSSSEKRVKGHGSTEDPTDLSRVGPRLRKKDSRKFLSDSDFTDSEKEVKKGTGDKGKSPEEQSTPGKKRKAIRKLIDDSKLDEKTKLADQRESERLSRLKKKKKTSSQSELEGEQLVLEVDNTTKNPKISVCSEIVPSLKPHQKEGIKFLYDSCVESLALFKDGQRNGAILAHCMGLGKTLQLIAFIDALLCCEESKVHRVIILSPVNTLYNWLNEFDRWLPNRNYGLSYIMNMPSLDARLRKLKRWFQHGGVMLIGYDMFRNLAMAKNVRKKKSREDLTKYLVDPGADIIVCDEGHVMRNSKSNLSVILGQVKTLCRIVLTGTPLQNNLMEYYTMVNFVKPNLLGTPREFRNRFVNPIKNGQCRDSQPSDIRQMKLRAHVLHRKVSGCVQRKDYRVLSVAIPPKQEYVISFHLTDIQDQLYRFYLDQFRGNCGATDLFSTFSNLAKVWNHPWVLRLSEERENEKAERKGLLVSDDDDDDEGSSLDGFIVSGSDEEDTKKKKRKVSHKRKKRGVSSSSSSRTSREPSLPQPYNSRPIIIISSGSGSDDDDLPPLLITKTEPGTTVKTEPGGIIDMNGAGPSNPGGRGGVVKAVTDNSSKIGKYWYDSMLTDDVEHKLEASGKLLFLMELLKQTEQRGEKVIVFSQSLLTLDLIESFLTEGENWTPGLDYYRLDGSTSTDVRQANMVEFNDESNSRIRLFLISTRAGSLGVNLVAANRVVIFDACWNPSHDLQAIFRTYRFGQTKPVFVYRLLALGTMEEKIYDRQVTKESLSKRVVDQAQIGRHYTASDLAELFTYSPKPPAEPPYRRPIVDHALCTILDKLQPQNINGYHEHDSLLEHIFDEELTEEEKKTAWDTYKQQTAVEAQKYNYDALALKLEEERLRLMAGSTLGQMLGLQGSLPTAQIPTPTAQIPAAQIPTAQILTQQDFKPRTQTVMSLPGAHTQRPSLPLTAQIRKQQDAVKPYNNAMQCLDTSISSFQHLLGINNATKDILKKQASGILSVEQARPMLTKFATDHKSLIKKCSVSVAACNSAIVAFNKSGLSQNPDLNKKIGVKRTLLDQYYKATLGNRAQGGQNVSAINSMGQSSSSSASSSLAISEPTVSSSID